MEETFTLIGTGGHPHASANGVTFQASINDELTLPICTDDEVDLHVIDLYLNNEVVALINYSFDTYIGKTAIYHNYATGSTFEFKIKEEKVILQ